MPDCVMNYSSYSNGELGSANQFLGIDSRNRASLRLVPVKYSLAVIITALTGSPFRLSPSALFRKSFAEVAMLYLRCSRDRCFVLIVL
jgi:hypothetical protein